jgi:hypothetical protein
MRTLWEVLNEKHKEVVEKWDRWNYNIYGPLSLNDLAEIKIWLINEDESMQEIVTELN